MKQVSMPLSKVHLGIRILLNLLFICFLVYAGILNNKGRFPVEYVICYNLILFVPAFGSSFRALPQFLLTRKVGRFILQIIMYFLVSMLLMGTILQTLDNQYDDFQLINITGMGISFESPFGKTFLRHYLDPFPGLLIVFLLQSIAFFVHEYIRRMREVATQNQQQIEAELALLKSQVSPHFLFNVLNNLYALSLVKSDKTPNVILQLSDILRYSLYESDTQLVPVQTELKILESYISIEALRAGNRLVLDFSVDLKDTQLHISPMLLLPLVENAFKHGVDSTVDRVQLSVNLKTLDGVLYFSCLNSFKPLLENEVGGIGLRNIQRRLDLLYPKKYNLIVEEQENQFFVSLEVNTRS